MSWARGMSPHGARVVGNEISLMPGILPTWRAPLQVLLVGKGDCCVASLRFCCGETRVLVEGGEGCFPCSPQPSCLSLAVGSSSGASLFPLSSSASAFPSFSVCSLARTRSLPPSPASSEPSVSFLFLFVWRTKAVCAAKGNEFKETAILDFLKNGEHTGTRECVQMCTLMRACIRACTRTHTHTHSAQEVMADSLITEGP